MEAVAVAIFEVMLQDELFHRTESDIANAWSHSGIATDEHGFLSRGFTRDETK